MVIGQELPLSAMYSHQSIMNVHSTKCEEVINQYEEVNVQVLLGYVGCAYI